MESLHWARFAENAAEGRLTLTESAYRENQFNLMIFADLGKSFDASQSSQPISQQLEGTSHFGSILCKHFPALDTKLLQQEWNVRWGAGDTPRRIDCDSNSYR